MPATGRQLRSLEHQIDQAQSYQEWLEIAQSIDQLQGMDAWRDDDASPHYHYALVKEHTATLRKHRKKGDVVALLTALEESLYRHLGEFAAPELYNKARAGTKRLITDFLDLFQNLDRLHTTALQMVSPMKMLKDKVILDSEQLFECIDSNSSGMTFREAYEESGLIINISVSPTRSRQKPRLLNYLTSPDVLVAHASLASCAIPGVFPPVTLMCKKRAGEIAPYMGTEKWTDGSVYGDIPVQRMSRLHNVNMAIVSQSNPHVIPFTALNKTEAPRLISNTTRAALSSIKAQATIALDFARSSIKYRPLRSLLDNGHAVLAQQYHGDINIHLPPHPAIYTKLLTNPDEQGMDEYMLLGCRATWPELAEIRDKTRISRAFDACIARLREKVKKT